MSRVIEASFGAENGLAANLYGANDGNLRFLEDRLNARVVGRGGEIHLIGEENEVNLALALLGQLRALAAGGQTITTVDIAYCLETLRAGAAKDLGEALNRVLQTTARGRMIKAKTIGQYQYARAIQEEDIVFGIGPAGTGKTYLAVVMAVTALKNKEVSRIILTRPAVEAGEKLGFLPGDLQEKVDPYLRPLYDGLFDILGVEAAQRYIEKSVIEIAPLAYMRGRTLDDSFIILDEAQNTTPEQMKMFLTRLGFNSRAVITGDVTQIDIARPARSGLVVAQRVLKGVSGIGFQYLTKVDVVRHPVVRRIIQAYELYEGEIEGVPRRESVRGGVERGE
ncbi:MAG: PhoH family protein [Peptococcaceae bacterium]|nr:PhoH family protein [Peptococcaceae bacterium]